MPNVVSKKFFIKKESKLREIKIKYSSGIFKR